LTVLFALNANSAPEFRAGCRRAGDGLDLCGSPHRGRLYSTILKYNAGKLHTVTGASSGILLGATGGALVTILQIEASKPR